MTQRERGPLFTLFGVPVRIEPWFFIIPAIALQTRDVAGALTWTVLILLGVLAHEFGHAFAMKRYGFQPAILLHGLGGLTQFPPHANPTPKQSFFITLAGPAMGLALGLVAYAAQQLVPAPSPALATALSDAVYINVLWSFVNLLPVLPWDGGHLLEAGLMWGTKKRHDRLVGGVSVVLGGLIVALAVFWQRSFLLGYLGAMGIWQGSLRWKQAV
jgi:Zn-dependent protease